MPGFRWKMGDYVGGDKAVHQAYKPWLVLRMDEPENDHALGEISVQPRDTSDIVISGLGFRPTALFLISYRPQLANGGSDSAFGDRGGGMTFGVAGHALVGPEWDSEATYSAGDVVRHESKRYIAVGGGSITSEPPSADWSYLPVTQFTGSSRIRHAFEPKYSYWNEDCCFRVVHDFGATEILKLAADFDDDGFTLAQTVNLYDQANPIAWLAMSGDIVVDVMTTGDTFLPFNGDPQGAMFLSTKHAPGETFRTGKWDHMQGFASVGGAQAAIWGGGRNDNWDWTTERWEDDRAIVLCDAADGASFLDASYDVGARVIDWTSGLTLDYPVYGNEQYRVGYVLFGQPADHGVLETNWETRQGGAQNDFPDEDANFEQTSVRPDIIFMAATNYNFSATNTNPFDSPRSPGQFNFCGSGGLGWHASPFSDLGYDAYGVHTFGNAVAERGRYANSGTQFLRRYILAGQGCTSQPPAYHQHSVNVIPNPRVVGMNFRSADRRGDNVRGLQSPTDVAYPA